MSVLQFTTVAEYLSFMVLDLDFCYLKVQDNEDIIVLILNFN